MDRHTHTHTHTHIFLKNFFRMWEWYRIENHQNIEVEFLDDCNISFTPTVMSLESKNIAQYNAQLWENLTNLVPILYLGSSCNYLKPGLFIFDLAVILRVVHIRKKFKIFIFSKMVPTFSSNFVDLFYIRTPRIWNYRLFPEKIFVTRIIFFNFLSVA